MWLISQRYLNPIDFGIWSALQIDFLGGLVKHVDL